MKVERKAGRFSYALTASEEGIVEADWRGHLSGAAVAQFLADLEQCARPFEDYLLLVDARDVEGYDPDACAVAARWSQGSVASRALVVAVVADSQLAAAESPATSLAPQSRACLFGSPAAARSYLLRRVPAQSGQFEAPVVRAAMPRRLAK